MRSGILSALAAVLTCASCTVSQTAIPPLSGPSQLALALTITATPATLGQDGVSQATIQVFARDVNAQPVPNQTFVLSMSAVLGNGLTVNGDYGTLSVRSIVTGANGVASAVYTAPVPPSIGSSTRVSINVAPASANGNVTTPSAGAGSLPQSVAITLIPTGVVIPASTPTAAFTTSPSGPTVNNAILFDATASCGGQLVNAACPAGVPAISTYAWTFGDGTTGTGQLISHTFTTPASFSATLTVTNAGGGSASVTQTIAVVLPGAPTAGFSFSPSAPVVSQAVNFNGSGSTVAFGHSITQFAWNFGDGTVDTTSGINAQHPYSSANTYSVSLTITDDTGQRASTSNSVVVGTGAPTAAFTFVVTNAGTHTLSFDGGSSVAIAPATITNYAWLFGDGNSSSGAASTTSHPYGAAGTYTVTLTVTDSSSRTGRFSQQVTVP